MAAAMWTSKLGNTYPMEEMQCQDVAFQRELRLLRSSKACGNHLCADCGSPDSSWASVSIGVFICVTCSDVHRSVGTHVSKVKGCTGTYLWGPDEIERMRAVGNARADEAYGAEKVSPDSSKEEKQRYVLRKYRASAPRAARGSSPAPPAPCSQAAGPPRPLSLPKAAQVAAAGRPRATGPSRSAPVMRRVEIDDAVFEGLLGELEAGCLQPDSSEDAPAPPLQQGASAGRTEALLDSPLRAPPQPTEPRSDGHVRFLGDECEVGRLMAALQAC